MYTIFALQYEGYIKQYYGNTQLEKLKDKQIGNQNSTVSVVVYVHNDAEGLSKCIESVIDQTYSDLEILLFDDASEDQSSEICDHLAERDDRIKVIHQQYMGRNATYKNAIGNVSGDWVSFLTGKDLVSKEFYYELQKRAEENEVDLICWNVNEHMSGRKMSLYYDKDILYSYMNEAGNNKLPHNMHNYIYKRDLLQRITGEVEDSVWSYQIMEQAHKCIAVYARDLMIQSRGNEKAVDVYSIIVEYQTKIRLNQKYFPKHSQEVLLLNYYKFLFKLYRRLDQYDEKVGNIVKTELGKYKNAVRKIVKYADYGRKRRAKIWFSTFCRFS